MPETPGRCIVAAQPAAFTIHRVQINTDRISLPPRERPREFGKFGVCTNRSLQDILKRSLEVCKVWSLANSDLGRAKVWRKYTWIPFQSLRVCHGSQIAGMSFWECWGLSRCSKLGVGGNEWGLQSLQILLVWTVCKFENFACYIGILRRSLQATKFRRAKLSNFAFRGRFRVCLRAKVPNKQSLQNRQSHKVANFAILQQTRKRPRNAKFESFALPNFVVCKLLRNMPM